MAAFFGVRHLSPACAYYVREFLDRNDPEIVLIEGPSDLNHLIEPLCSNETKMPAAILAYTEDSPVKTVLFPLAEFSPEYQAMKWAVRNGRRVMFCDLPSTCLLARQNEEEKQDEDKTERISVYTEMEKVSGTDNDSFWEYTFEQCESYDDFLEAVSEYGRSLRELSENDGHNRLRESYMRRVISECENDVPSKKICVITGAFHTAGIKDIPFSDDDRRLTKNLSAVKAKATLMPYSYYRLSSRSGYGAGSRAPAYFELLWNSRLKNAVGSSSDRYLSMIAAYQRENGYAASTAEVIEAKRLADTLAAMRGGKFPNMTDLRDAAISCIGHGSFGEISLACADTEIGTKIGSLPDGTVCTSVQEDFTRQLRELKLEKYRKASAEDIELDLRENLRVKSEKSAFLDLNRSFFLHRLRILGISFAEAMPRAQDNATWAERWKLQWTPEAEIEIVEASLKGDTVKLAAEYELNFRLLEADSVNAAAIILSDAFDAGLTECISSAISAIQKQTADCSSAEDTGKTIGTLSAIVRFGGIRRIASEPIYPLMEKLYLRYCLCMPSAAVCDRNGAEQLIISAAAVNDACLSHDFLDSCRFITLLSDIADNNFANPLLSGYSTAILTERGEISSEKLSELISRHLSAGTPPAEAAMWFEGLARRNRRSLISRLSVWEKLCDFVAKLDDDGFKPVLVALRRTFSDFSPAERSDIAENIGEVLGISKEAAAEFVTMQLSSDEQQSIDELDDFDFGDI
ncbi:MAG: DUF5682 family protein [Oscillospiraceae bacterium]|nr:DUF5682 family protein [Oscillospiraceae bacterium]